jgi:hypothetical protein
MSRVSSQHQHQHQDLRRYIVTALGLLSEFEVDSNPALRDRDSRQAFEHLNHGLSRLGSVLGLGDRQKVRAEFSSELARVRNTLHSACVVLGRYKLRVAQVAETPLSALVRFVEALGSRIEESVNSLEAAARSTLVPAATSAVMAGAPEDSESLRNLLEEAEDASESKDVYAVPLSFRDKLRPDAAMTLLRCLFLPLTLEQKSQGAYSLEEEAGLPPDLVPSPAQWLQLYSGVLASWEEGMHSNMLHPGVEKRIILSKVKRAPVNSQAFKRTILVNDASEYESEVDLESKPGEPYTLVMRAKLTPSSVYRVLLAWIRGGEEMATAPETGVREENSKFVADTQEELDSQQEKFSSQFAHGEACASIGFSANGEIVLQADMWRVRSINLPRGGDDKARYLLDLHTDNRHVFGSRDGLEKNAELVGKSVGWRVVSVSEHRYITRSTFCYGMTVWWSIPGPVFSSTISAQLMKIFLLCGKTPGTKMGLEELLEYMKDQGLTLENSGGSDISRIYDSARSLALKIQSLLADSSLALPPNVQNSLKILLTSLEGGKVRNLEHLNTTIPSKLDYISQSYRAASPLLLLDGKKLKAALKSRFPSLDSGAYARLIHAGVDPKALPSKERLTEALLIQAARDRAFYRGSCPLFRIRVPFPDPRKAPRSEMVLADVHSGGLGLVLRSKHGALEYEVKMSSHLVFETSTPVG